MVVMSRNMTRRSGEGEERVDLPPNQLRLYVNSTGDRWSAAALKDTLNQMMNPILRSMQRTEERERAERERAEEERAEREGAGPEPEAAGSYEAAAEGRPSQAASWHAAHDARRSSVSKASGEAASMGGTSR